MKRSLLAISFVMVFASVITLFSPFQKSAYADLSQSEKQDCFNNFNGKQLDASAFDGPCFNTANGNFCTLSNQDVASCPDPSNGQADAATLAKAHDAEVAPLIKLVCGTVPRGGAAVDIYNACADQVTTIYGSCSLVNEGPLAGTTIPPDSTAQCAVPLLNKISGGRRVTQASATSAITSGRAASKKILDDDTAAKLKKACEDKGGTYANGECTGGTEQQTVCAGGQLGWLLCPLAKLFNDATSLVADQLEQLLIFKPLLVGNNGASMKAIWSIVLNISNVALVIVFLVVVFSQATSVGLSAYGIKKLLPKLVAAAILVNLSFYICAFGIDVSNILGESVKGIISAGYDAIDKTGALAGIKGPSWLAAFWDFQIAGVAALIAGAAGALPLILPVVAAGAVAVITAFFIIGMRIVLLTLLVVVSPLAFVAWILPNTSQMFTRWRKLFIGLLLMYPIVMAIFYGAALVSAIVLAS